MSKRLAKIILSLVGIVTIGLAFAATTLSFDYNFENFFPYGDEDLEYFLDYREAFENDNDYLLIGIKNNEGIYDSLFLNKLNAVTQQLDSLSLTTEVLSLTNFRNPIITPMGPIMAPVLHIDKPAGYAKDSAFIATYPAINGTLISPNGTATAIVVRHVQQISKAKADSLMQQVDRILEKAAFDEVHVAGKVKAQAVYVSRMQKEFVWFASLSILLVVIFLWFTYRAAWGVLVPLLVVLLAVIWTLGTMALLGKKIDIMMALLPTIMFVVGMSDVVHLLTKYIEELRNGLPKREALKITVKEIGLATFLTSLTTAIGFLTLLTSNIKPIRDFGLYVAIGVFIAFSLTFLVMPAVLTLVKTPKVVNKAENKLLWTNTLRNAFSRIIQRRKLIWVVSAVVLLVSAIGITRLEQNTFLLEDIRENDPLKQDFYFFDRNFGGNKPFEMAIQLQDTSRTLFDPAVLNQLQIVETYLTDSFGAANLVSPLLLAKGGNMALNGGQPSYFKIPEEKYAQNRLFGLLKRLPQSTQNIPIISKDGNVGRFTGRSPDWGSQASIIKTAQLQQFLAQHTDSTLVKFRLTGTSVLIDKNAGYILDNMLEGLGIAFIVIALIAGLLYRNLVIVFIALLVNILPLLLIAGFMGWADVYLKASTSIIFTIAFGIAVDDTIHFLSKLKLELNNGRSLPYAIKHTYMYTGKAIIITSIILAGGFLTLLFSDFGSTFYTGLLVSLTLIFAVLADLTLLPVLILTFIKNKKTD